MITFTNLYRISCFPRSYIDACRLIISLMWLILNRSVLKLSILGAQINWLTLKVSFLFDLYQFYHIQQTSQNILSSCLLLIYVDVFKGHGLACPLLICIPILLDWFFFILIIFKRSHSMYRLNEKLR